MHMCACTKCHGGHHKTLRTIEAHQQEYGRDNHLFFSILGGNPPSGYLPKGIWINEFGERGAKENMFDDADTGSVYAEELDKYHDV